MNKKHLSITIAAILLVGVAVFLWSGRTPKAPAVFDHASHPAKRVSFWKEVISRPLERRLIDAPPMLIDYVNKDNVSQGWPANTRSIKLEEPFKSELRQALMTLPAPVLAKLEGSLAFITVVKELGGSGYTDHLVSETKGFAPYSFIVLDVASLDRKANEWMSWKESSPFKAEPGWQLTATIEEPSSDDRMHAIQYLLLHELGHVLSYSFEDFPRGSDPKATLEGKMRLGWPAISWVMEGDSVFSRYDKDFPWRGKIAYYAPEEKKQPFALSLEAYGDLARTDFATLYATTNFGDDFAESFASFVHTELQGRPWQIRIDSAGGEPFVYESCWKQARCKKKRLVLESVLGL